MSRYNYYLLILFLLLQACQGNRNTKSNIIAEPGMFIPLDTNFYTQKLILPPAPLTSEMIFQAGDIIQLADGSTAAAKGMHDFLAFIPNKDNPDRAWLWCNHESASVNAQLGDGGGGTLLVMSRKDGKWTSVGKFHVDFSDVGGTLRNCLGAATPWGTIITSEECNQIHFQIFHSLQLPRSLSSV